MINEEKVILMTKASLYEEKKGKEKLKIMNYFRHDYISLQMLYGWFFMTVSFVLCTALWGACHMEYLMDNLHKMDLKQFGMTVLFIYAMVTGIYVCILYIVCAYRYYEAKKSVGSYANTLRKISDIYVRENKHTVSDAVMEEKNPDKLS